MKRIIFALWCVLLLMVFCACGADDTQGNGESLNAGDPIVVGVLPDTQSVPIIVAQHMGYFDEEKVTVDIQPFTSAPERDSAIQSGSVNTVNTDLIAVALFRQSELDMEAILSTDGSQQILASANSGVISINELTGKTLTMSENTIMDYASDRILAYYSVDKNTVEYSYIPQITVRMEMLINHNVDAAIMPEPQVSVAKADGATILASSEDLNLNATCLGMRSEITASHPEAVKAFVRAYNKAVVYLNDTPAEEYMDWVIEETGFPESVSDTLTLPVYREASAPSEADVFDVMDWMIERGLIEEAFAYDDMVNIEFTR
jgi:NitT/TauT family transport system substrate-binding protein